MRLALFVIGLAACGGSSSSGGGLATCNFPSDDICSSATSADRDTATLDKDCTAQGGTIASGCSTTNLVGTCSDIDSSDGLETINLYSPTYTSLTAETYCNSAQGLWTPQ